MRCIFHTEFNPMNIVILFLKLKNILSFAVITKNLYMSLFGRPGLRASLQRLRINTQNDKSAYIYEAATV